MIAHHLDETTIMRLACGDVDEAFAVVATAHLAMCAECSDAVRTAEEIGGEMLLSLDEAHLSDDAVECMMRSIDVAGGLPNPAKPSVRHDTIASDVPAPLVRFVGPSLNNIDWSRPFGGVRKRNLRLGPECTSSLYMLKIASGKSMPEHGHGGSEMTLVLSGAYRDEIGRFGPGDIADLDEHIEHRPIVDSDEPCICVVATEAPTRFKSLIGKALQPLHGL